LDSAGGPRLELCTARRPLCAATAFISIVTGSFISLIGRKYYSFTWSVALERNFSGASRGCEIKNKKNSNAALLPIRSMTREFNVPSVVKFFTSVELIFRGAINRALAGLFAATTPTGGDSRPLVKRIPCRDRVIGRDNFDDCSWVEIRECMYKDLPSFRPLAPTNKRPDFFEGWPDIFKSVVAPFRGLDALFVARVMAPVFLLMLVFIIFSIIVQVSIAAVPRIVEKVSHESWLGAYERDADSKKKSLFLRLYFRR
jgi:hypothetical protein